MSTRECLSTEPKTCFKNSYFSRYTALFKSTLNIHWCSNLNQNYTRNYLKQQFLESHLDIVVFSRKMIHLPCSNISRSDNSFTGSSENTRQIESFVSSGLNVITKLNYNNICHCVAILREKNNTKWRN